MRVNYRVIIEECIGDGVARGFHLAYKHTENPTREALIERIEDSIMSKFLERFFFDFE